MLLFLLVACEAVPVDSGVYFASNTADTPPPDTTSEDEGFCPELLSDSGVRYTGSVSQQRNDQSCEGSAALIWGEDDTITFRALCTGNNAICLTASGTVSGDGAISAALSMSAQSNPTSGPHDITGTIDDSEATLSWTFAEKDPKQRELVFVGEATLAP